MSEESIYYDKQTIAILKKKLLDISPSTLHKMMNPFCGPCVFERGLEALNKINAKD